MRCDTRSRNDGLDLATTRDVLFEVWGKVDSLRRSTSSSALARAEVDSASTTGFAMLDGCYNKASCLY